jgi:hypothetical protein
MDVGLPHHGAGPIDGGRENAYEAAQPDRRQVSPPDHGSDGLLVAPEPSSSVGTVSRRGARRTDEGRIDLNAGKMSATRSDHPTTVPPGAEIRQKMGGAGVQEARRTATPAPPRRPGRVAATRWFLPTPCKINALGGRARLVAFGGATQASVEPLAVRQG